VYVIIQYVHLSHIETRDGYEPTDVSTVVIVISSPTELDIWLVSLSLSALSCFPNANEASNDPFSMILVFYPTLGLLHHIVCYWNHLTITLIDKTRRSLRTNGTDVRMQVSYLISCMFNAKA
jgi:hypothetical protein